jgi:hypothetical protein
MERGTTKKRLIFGGNPFVRVTVDFSEEEKEVIKRSDLGTFLIYDHPWDLYCYEQAWEAKKTAAPGSVAATDTPERYRWSRFVHHFLKNPTHDISPYPHNDMGLMHIENSVKENLEQLKALIVSVLQHPTGKKTFEL